MNRVKITKFRLGTYDNFYFLYNELKQITENKDSWIQRGSEIKE
jgi:hypothetical protein